MLEKNPDTLKIVFKNFPLGSHKMARPAAESAMAAHKQGRFWEFHDKIFSYITSPTRKKLDQNELNQIPIELGLDMDRFLKDLKDPAIEVKINQDFQEGVKAGVTGTPSIYINGRKVKRRTPQIIQFMIDQELREK